MMFQLFEFGRDDDLAITRLGVLIVILLVVILGFVKSLERHDLRHNRVMEILLRLEWDFSARSFCFSSRYKMMER